MRLHRHAVAVFVLAVGLALAPAALHAQQSDATPAPAPGPTNPPLPSPRPTAEDPKVHKLAVQQFLAWQSGAVNRDLYSDRVNSDMTDDLMDRGTKALANLGGLQSAQFQGVSLSKGMTFFVYKMLCQNGTIQMEFEMDPDGKIGLIFFE